MKRFLTIISVISILGFAGYAFSAPTSTYERNIYPTTSSTYEIGTSTRSWKMMTADQFCLTNGTCATSTFGTSYWYVTSTVLDASSTQIFTSTSVSGIVTPYTHVWVGASNFPSDPSFGVSGNIYATGEVRSLGKVIAGAGSGFSFHGQENGGFYLDYSVGNTSTNFQSPNALKFLVGVNNATNTQAMIIDAQGMTTLDPSQGYPATGRTLPTTTLTIVGNTNASGSLYVAGDVGVNLYSSSTFGYIPGNRTGLLTVYGPPLTATSTYGKSGYLSHNGTSFIFGGSVGNQVLQFGSGTSTNAFSEQAYFINGTDFSGGLQSGYNWYVSTTTKKMALSNDGNLGIGNDLNLNLTNTIATNPIDAKLMIQTPDDTPLLNLKDSTGALLASFSTTSTIINVTTTLTTTSISRLSVGADSVFSHNLGGVMSNDNFTVRDDSAGVSIQLALERFSTSATRGAFQYFLTSSGTVAAPAILTNGRTVGGIFFAGNDGSGTDPTKPKYDIGATIKSSVDGTVATNVTPLDLTFQTQELASQGVITRQRIRANGDTTFGLSTNPINFQVFGTSTLATTTAAKLSVSNLTSGSVIFAGANGLLSQDNSNLFWDDTNNWLGIGTKVPSGTLHIYSPQNSTFAVQTASTTGYSIINQTTPNQEWRWVAGDNLGGSGVSGYLLQDGLFDGGSGKNYLIITTSTFEIFARDASGLPFVVNAPTTTFNGNIGIGTYNPSASIHSYSSSNAEIRVETTATSTGAYLSVYSPNQKFAWVAADDFGEGQGGAVLLDVNTNNAVFFYMPSEQLVGIGSNSVTSAIQFSGLIKGGKGVSLSATTTLIIPGGTNYFPVNTTPTSTINGISLTTASGVLMDSGTEIKLLFQANNILVHHSGAPGAGAYPLYFPTGAANITTVNGQICTFTLDNNEMHWIGSCT